jgi:hypothetical protein
MPLITTSRIPSSETAAFCRRLASLLDGSTYVPRDKKELDEMLRMAEKLGMSRMLIVSEEKGRPSMIGAMEVGREGAGWREDELKIIDYKIFKPAQKPKPTGFTVSGDAREYLSHFSGIDEEAQTPEPDHSASYLQAGCHELVFMYEGAKSLEISYKVIPHAKG